MTESTEHAPHPSITSLALADLILLTSRVMTSPCRLQANEFDIQDAELATLVEAAGGARELARALASLRDEAGRVDREVWQSEHTRLFDGPVACPINETAYIRRDKGAIISDICGFYRAFGFEPDGSCGEKADHFICELEFVGVLLVMLGEAQRADESDNVEVVEAAARSFLAEHLGEWLLSFCQRLMNTTELPLFGCVEEVLREVWNVLARRFDLPHFDALNEVPDDPLCDDEATPYECGLAEAEEEARLVELTGPPNSGLPMNPESGGE